MAAIERGRGCKLAIELRPDAVSHEAHGQRGSIDANSNCGNSVMLPGLVGNVTGAILALYKTNHKKSYTIPRRGSCLKSIICTTATQGSTKEYKNIHLIMKDSGPPMSESELANLISQLRPAQLAKGVQGRGTASSITGGIGKSTSLIDHLLAATRAAMSFGGSSLWIESPVQGALAKAEGGAGVAFHFQGT
jgi:hypothetical protein